MHGDTFAFDSLDYSHYKEKGDKIIHWLPINDNLVSVEVLMDDGTAKLGLGEPTLTKLKQGDIIQFERMFFARFIQEKDSTYKFLYLHP